MSDSLCAPMNNSTVVLLTFTFHLRMSPELMLLSVPTALLQPHPLFADGMGQVSDAQVDGMCTGLGHV